MTKYYSIAITFFLSLSLYGQDLQILTPNGGEEFQAGTEVLITWEGVSEDDTVSIKFSSDNGGTWEALTEVATENEYKWNAPKLESDECLIRITHKANKYGGIEWEKTYGGSDWDVALSIQQTSDDGYIVAGLSNSFDGDIKNPNGEEDYFILKLNSNGRIEWNKTYGGTDRDDAFSIQQTIDGGYIIAGHSKSKDGDVSENKGRSDYWVVKLNKEGNLEWEKSYGGSESDLAYSIQQTKNGGYIVAGRTRSTDGDITENKGHYDYWILKLNKNGNIEWNKTYGGSGGELANSIIQTKDNGYIIAGRTSSTDGDVSENEQPQACWIIKIRENGDLEWEKTYGGSDLDYAYSIQQTLDGGYIVAGTSRSTDGDVSENKGNSDFWILKLKENGDLEWEKTYGGSAHDQARSIQQTIDGGYIVAGYSSSSDGDVSENKGSSDYWILKLKTDGSLDWEKSFGGIANDYARSIQQITDGGYIVAGQSQSTNGDVSKNKGSSDYWIIKISESNILQSDTSDAPFSIIIEEEEDENEPDTSYSFDFYISPNATSDKATLNLELQEEMDIELIMYDNLGRKMLEIFNGTAPEGKMTIDVDMSSFSSARYYIRLITPEQTMTKIIELLN